MKHLQHLALLSLAAVVPAVALAQEPASTPDPAQAPVVTEAEPAVVPAVQVPVAEDRWTAEERASRVQALIDAPLSVNGTTISPAEVRRQLVLYKGRTQLESRKLDLMIEVELTDRERIHNERMAALQARVDAGEAVDEEITAWDPSPFELSEEEQTKAYEDALAAIREQYPNMDVEDVLASNSLNLVGLQRSLTQTTRFDRVFLPDDPELWPPATEAALEKQLGAEMLPQMKANWAQRAETDQSNPGAAMWNGLMRRMVVQSLMADAVVETPVDGLADDVAQRVNGSPTRVDDIWPEVESLVHPEDVRFVRRYLARSEAVRQDLTERGAWLSDEEFQAVYDAEAAVGEGTPWTIEMIVMVMKRYPTMDAYKQVLRGMKSYEGLIEDELTDQNLTDTWLPRASRLLGLGETECQIILLSAFDYPRNRWIDGGWEEAEQRAIEVIDALVESGGEAWDELIATQSDFFDPPQAPQQQQMGAPQDRKDQGRFGRIHRNRLMQMLGESEFTSFVDGASVADTVYYEQEVGTIDGPFRGVHGYYITRVDSRTVGKKAILLTDPNMRQMVVQDYVMQTFLEYAAAQLDNAEVVGLDV